MVPHFMCYWNDNCNPIFTHPITFPLHHRIVNTTRGLIHSIVMKRSRPNSISITAEIKSLKVAIPFCITYRRSSARQKSIQKKKKREADREFKSCPCQLARRVLIDVVMRNQSVMKLELIPSCTLPLLLPNSSDISSNDSGPGSHLSWTSCNAGELDCCVGIPFSLLWVYVDHCRFSLLTYLLLC